MRTKIGIRSIARKLQLISYQVSVKLYYRSKYKELLLITGKGLHSTSDKDTYTSKDFGKLKFSVPEFIRSDLEINKLIVSINEADIKDGGEGAILIKLRNL